MAEPVYHNEGSVLRNLANDPEVKIFFRIHAQDEMRKDGLEKDDISSILKTGFVIKVEKSIKHGNWTWRVKGISDEVSICAECVVDEQEKRITIITAWKNKGKGG